MIAKSLHYKEQIGDIKRKKISILLYAASSIENQINMNDSFLCWMIGQVLKRNRILLFQNLAMEMTSKKMQKNRRLFERTKKQQLSWKKSRVKVAGQQLCMKWGLKRLVGFLKVHHSLTNHEIWNRYVNHSNIQGRYLWMIYSQYKKYVYTKNWFFKWTSGTYRLKF